jgi:hypothetical protein
MSETLDIEPKHVGLSPEEIYRSPPLPIHPLGDGHREERPRLPRHGQTL